MTGKASIATFRSSDGYRWYYRFYQPAGPARGRVVAIHGIQSHSGWYTHSCERLAAEGYEVYFLDRRGSGWNTAHRGDIPGFRRVLDDYGEFLRSLPADGLPRVLVAISWGGKLGLGLTYRHPGLIDGLALLCPGIVAKVQPPFLQRLLIGRARVRCPWKKFPIPLNDPALFTASTEWQNFVRNDRYALREATARILFASFALDFYVKRARKHVTMPVLLLLAGKDEVIDNGGVRAYVEKLPAASKKIIEYPEAHHTLEFEGMDHPWIGDLICWLRGLYQAR